MMLNRVRRLSRAFSRDAVVLWYACRNPLTPLQVRVLAALLIIYMISPLDLVPDALPILGWMDDFALLSLAIPAVLKIVPSQALYEARLAADRLLSRWKFWRARP